MTKDPLARFALILFTGFLFFGALYFARNILIPISFAALLSMLMLPVCKKLEHWKFPRWAAILSCLLILLMVISGFVFVFTSQIISFSDNLPKYRNAFNNKIENIQELLERTIKVSPKEQITFLKEKGTDFLENGGQYVKVLLLTTTGTLATIGVVLVYTFFFLYFRDRFKNFILKITAPENEEKTLMIINKSSKVTAKYLAGVFIVISILSVLNSIGLLILGLDYAIFFGITVAILNIIPYIGVPLGAILPVTMALITKDSFWTAAGVAGVFVINQFIENNFLTPNIVGNRVNLNPLATILTLLTGASIWGIAGMIIFLPFLGVIKITLDHIEALQPYAFLIGIDESPKSLFILRIKNFFIKKKNTLN
jgi:predicted PurR-regulated permease PerM